MSDDLPLEIIEDRRRKHMLLSVDRERIILKVPFNTPYESIVNMLYRHRNWIDIRLNQQKEAKEIARQKGILGEKDIPKLKEQAFEDITKMADYYAKIIGVDYKKIEIGLYKNIWGSCSSEGTLSFNLLLMLAPPKIRASVVCHELCHRRVFSHRKEFYDILYKYFPEYEQSSEWLRENQDVLENRIDIKS